LLLGNENCAISKVHLVQESDIKKRICCGNISPFSL
jgi:hypothetical protein